jgi:Clp amino terminal domain, pathogenicity island component
VTGQVPFTPRAKKVLELSLREALSLGHNYIGTEHILLGLVREGEGVAMRILVDYDVDAEKIRERIVRRLAREPAPPDPIEELAPDLRAEVDRVRAEKAEAIAAQEFERAASLRIRERNLIRLGREGDVEGFREEAARPLPEARLPSMPLPPRRTHALHGTRVLAPAASAVAVDRPLAFFLAGGATFGVALGIGILIGRLIWG